MAPLPELNLHTKKVIVTGTIRFSEEDERELRRLGLMRLLGPLGNSPVISDNATLQVCRIADKQEGLRLLMSLGECLHPGIQLGLKRTFGQTIGFYKNGGAAYAAVEMPHRHIHNAEQYMGNRTAAIAHSMAELFIEAAKAAMP
jgi:hypothetical protein